jgi:protein-tyrosine phosphatase
MTTVLNMRDIGGWPARDGLRVRESVLYRSAELGGLGADDMTTLTNLGLKTIYDLRTEDERVGKPDVVPPGVDYIVLDILRDSAHLAPAKVIQVLGDPTAADAMLGGGKAASLFEDAYREAVTLPSALAGYRRFFSDLLGAERRPALFHCTTGKDRTGWASAVMLMLLGVDDDVVMHEYMLTNEQLLPALEPVFAQFESAGGDRDVLLPVLGVRPSYLDAARGRMAQAFGTIEGYFTDGLGLDSSEISDLRSTFTAR